jgi:hypothetical protein
MSITLRDLPLPVKVVASVFLMAVGVGYTSAMVQLHMQDAKSGEAMPTVADVIRKFTGKTKADPNDPALKPVCRLEALVTCPSETISGNSMSGAFTTQDRGPRGGRFAEVTRGRGPADTAAIRAQRAGEQTIVVLWINAPDEERKAAYAADKYVPATGKMPKAITPEFCLKAPTGDAIKIKSILDTRCVSCHSNKGEKPDLPLDTYDALAKFMAVAEVRDGEWVKVEEPMSITKLTQSTHAHLLSFAMLFSLTGLVFALSSYPVWFRCILGPWVVLAVFADVSLWWLARLCDEWGPVFAMGVIGTGALTGLGLAAQITLSLFNMYGPKGKAVLVMLIILAAALAGLVYVNKVKPELDAKKCITQTAKTTEPTAPTAEPDRPKPPAQLDLGAVRDRVVILMKVVFPEPIGETAAKVVPSELERMLLFPLKDENGKALTLEETAFGGGDDGSMARAFFDKEKVYKSKMNDESVPKADKDKLHAARDGERQALIAWSRAADPARKASFDADKFALSKDLTGQPISPEYVKDGQVLVKTLIADRCLRCHGPGGNKFDEFPLHTYDDLRKYLNPPLPPMQK